MQSLRTKSAGRAAALRVAVVAGCALWLCACNTDQQAAGLPAPPNDYRLRHPITLQESDHSIELFVGSNRAELNPTQRAQVLAFGIAWKRDATGGIVIARPVGSPNEAASGAAMREIVSILTAGGLPPRSIVVRTYPAFSTVAAIRIGYPRITAQAGPCGLWPKDIGPSAGSDYFQNRPYWNFGCSTQHNLAAEVADPADLVQPRAETAPYQMRRSVIMEKYRTGQNAATQDSSNTQSSKISDVGK